MASSAVLERLGVALGSSWGRLEAVLGAPWGRLGGVLGRLGTSWGHLGDVLERLGGLLGRHGWRYYWHLIIFLKHVILETFLT